MDIITVHGVENYFETWKKEIANGNRFLCVFSGVYELSIDGDAVKSRPVARINNFTRRGRFFLMDHNPVEK